MKKCSIIAAAAIIFVSSVALAAEDLAKLVSAMDSTDGLKLKGDVKVVSEGPGGEKVLLNTWNDETPAAAVERPATMLPKPLAVPSLVMNTQSNGTAVPAPVCRAACSVISSVSVPGLTAVASVGLVPRRTTFHRPISQ